MGGRFLFCLQSIKLSIIINKSIKRLYNAKIISYIEKVIMLSGVILLIALVGIILWYSLKMYLRFRRGAQLQNGNLEDVHELNEI